jgi:5-hydroxyisourate hydrolase-like protein (transthyretin family)
VVDAELADAASLSGTVTDNAAASVPGIWVNLHRLDPSTGQRVYLSSRTSGEDGTYSFGGLMSGTYFVDFSDLSPSVTYAREYYNGKPTSDAADAVTLLPGQDVTGIDATLDLAGQLTGTVLSDADGNPIQFVTVTAYRLNEVSGNWDYASGASTNATGVYSMRGLTAGSYRVEFYDISGNHLREFHNDKATFALADSFAIPSGGAVVIDASLAPASRIEGTVTREGSGLPGTPLAGITVDAYRVLAPDSFEYVFSATTDPNGNYSVGGLNAGIYRISFNDDGGYYLPEVHANATGLSTGTDIAVAATSTISGIDAALIAGGRISGTVTDAVASSALQGIGIYFYRDNGVSWEFEAFAESDSAGGYTSPALPIGQYRVEFYDFSELPSYRGEYHDNTYNFNDSTAVTVNALQTTGSIDAALSPIDRSNVISGSVTDDATSAALAGIHAQAYLFNSVSGRYEFEAEAVSDGAGAYRIENLPSGLFRVRFSDRTNGTYAQQFYAGSSTLTGGSQLSLGTQDSISGIDAAMLPAMTISGTVRNESGDGIEGVSVLVRRWEPVNNDWFLVNSTQTPAGGAYSVNGLPDGTYRVEFLPVGGSGYFREFYNDAQTLGSATDLHVFQFLNGNLTNIDAELSTTAPATVTPAIGAFRKTGPTSYQSDFRGQPGTMYQLERSATMLPQSWVPDGAPFEAQPEGNVLNMSSSEPRMFWRVREN